MPENRPRIPRRRQQPGQTAKRAKHAKRPTASSVGYRYVSPAEAAAIRAHAPWRVPNVDLAGKPKLVYFTMNLYTSAALAEAALQIGAHHPAGPFPAPSERADLDLTGITYTYVGIVPGGTGTELTTPDSPPVTAFTALGP